MGQSLGAVGETGVIQEKLGVNMEGLGAASAGHGGWAAGRAWPGAVGVMRGCGGSAQGVARGHEGLRGQARVWGEMKGHEAPVGGLRGPGRAGSILVAMAGLPMPKWHPSLWPPSAFPAAFCTQKGTLPLVWGMGG